MSSLQIHEIIELTRANGPGRRTCVWVQGCSLACPGCFNPTTHEFGIGQSMEVRELADLILSLKGIEGVTISGGEPLQQADGILELLELLKKESELSTLIFSGFDRQEIERFPFAQRLYSLVDAIIAGRFREELRVATGLLGSSNQEIILCSTRYNHSDFEEIAPLELLINADGSITLTGVDPPEFIK